MNEMSRFPRPCRIALLGFGTVGSAVAARLAHRHIPQLHLTHVFDRDPRPARALLGSDTVCTTDIAEVLSSEADIIVEALGDLEPARTWIGEALARGKSVVTSNKQVVARHGRELRACAAQQRRQLRFEAAVGSAMPILAAIRDGLSGDRITKIDAVLNGTTTFVLSAMESTRCSLAQAVRQAQAQGLAEADPSSDLDGHDAAAKLAILATLAFGVEVDLKAVHTHGIEELPAHAVSELHRRGRTIRQVATAAYDWDRATLRATVGPRELPQRSFLGRTTGAGNAALIVCERAGTVGLFGCGAGGDAAAVAILSDLLAIAREAIHLSPIEPQPAAAALANGTAPLMEVR